MYEYCLLLIMKGLKNVNLKNFTKHALLLFNKINTLSDK